MTGALERAVVRGLELVPKSPIPLAVSRIVLYTTTLGLYLRYYLPTPMWTRFDEHFWRPISFFRAFGLGLPSEGTLELVQWLFLASALLAAIGLFTRGSTVASLLLGTYLFAIPQNFVKIHHNTAIVVFLFLVMAFSRCGDALSLDRWLQRRRDPSLPRVAPPDVEYAWPIAFGWCCFALVMFSAGLAKFEDSGFRWAFSDGMANRLIAHAYFHFPPTDLGLWVARHPSLSQGLAAVALCAELASPLVLVHRVPRAVLAVTILGMQLGIVATMGIRFYAMFPLYAFFVPWDRVFDFVARRLPGSAPSG